MAPISNETKFEINGSGLFNWNSSLTDERKLEILSWFKGLTKEEQKYVNEIRSEGYDDGTYDEKYDKNEFN